MAHFNRSSFRRLLRPFGATQVEKMIRQTAELCREAVEQRLTAAIGSMNRNEARGYLRARARRPVEHHLRLMSKADSRIDARLADQMIAGAIDQIVTSLLRERMLAPATIPVRRAA